MAQNTIYEAKGRQFTLHMKLDDANGKSTTFTIKLQCNVTQTGCLGPLWFRQEGQPYLASCGEREETSVFVG